MLCKQPIVAVVTLISLLLGGLGAAWAQPLAEEVPADALAYVGWAGAAGLGKEFEGSHFQGFLKSTNYPQLLGRALAQVSQMTKDEQDAQKAFQAISIFGAATWKYPCAMYVRPAPEGARPDSPPRFVAMWQAGEQAPALLAQVQPLLQADKSPEAPKAIQAGPFVVIYAGTTTEAEAKAARPATSLVSNPRFKQAMAQVRPNAIAVAYVDGEAIIAAVNRAIDSGADANAKTEWPKEREALGLTGLKRLVWSAGFDGQDWATQLFIDAPAPRKGLAKLFEAGAASVETIKLASRNATWVSASRLDLAMLFDEWRTCLAAIKPERRAEFDQGLQAADTFTGVDIEQFIRSLGPEWLFYADALTAGPNGMGFVVINTPRDAAKVEGAMAGLEEALNEQMATRMRAGAGGPNFQFRVIEQDGVKIHTLTTIAVSPTWAVHEQKLYIGLFPQSVTGAASLRKDQPGSILDNPKYVELSKRLGGPATGSVTFVDLPETAMKSYQTMLMMAQMAGMAPQMQAAGNPLATLLPPLASIMPHLSPAGSVGWADAQGYHMNSLTPFPGADFLGPQGSQMSTAQVAFGVGLMLPALGAARTTARQMQTSTQLRGIHQGMVLYSAGNNDKYPDHMGQLLEGNYFTKAYTMAPTASRTTPFPPDFDQWPSEKKGQWLAENGSFVILRWGKKAETDPKMIVGYLKPSHSDGRGIAMVYDDNSTRWEVPLDHALEMIHEQYPDHQIQGLEPAKPATQPAPR